MLIDIINRERFNYSGKMILAYIFKCMCLMRKKTMRDNPKTKHHFLFERAQEKLDQELDVITLLKSLRKLKLMT